MHQKLCHILRERGLTPEEIREMLLYELNNTVRQEQMLEWLGGHSDCAKEEISARAREILRGHLAVNPYNTVREGMPVPKWRGSAAERAANARRAAEKPKEKPKGCEEAWKDPFDEVLKAFFERFG